MIRRAADADAEAIARVHLRTWRVAYRGIVPDAYLHAMSLATRTERWRDDLPNIPTWVAVAAGAIVGFVARTPETDPAEIYALYVDPDHWAHGVGAALLAAALEGCVSAGLWCFEDNPRARRFYEAAGFRHGGERRVQDRGGLEAAEIHYMLSPPSTSTVRPLK